MAAEDVHAQVLGWALDETAKHCFAEDLGVAVTWAPVPLQTPAGPVLQAVWMLLLTLRSPILGESPLFHMVQIGFARPAEDDVRKLAAQGVDGLRTLRSQKLSGLNGKHPVLAGGRG